MTENAKTPFELVSERPYWYHKIPLPDGTTTPGMDLEPIWDNIRSVRSEVNYEGARVLDIASFDGLWAIEAESAGESALVCGEGERGVARIRGGIVHEIGLFQSEGEIRAGHRRPDATISEGERGGVRTAIGQA